RSTLHWTGRVNGNIENGGDNFHVAGEVFSIGAQIGITANHQISAAEKWFKLAPQKLSDQRIAMLIVLMKNSIIVIEYQREVAPKQGALEGARKKREQLLV